jgi:glycosyltransferase involved in cell wall biosynthesis
VIALKIVFIAPSTIPSETANSIQVMKVSQALTQLGHETTLVVPGVPAKDMALLKQHYGISTMFPLRWFPARKGLRRIDFCWQAVRFATEQSADIVYTRMIWAALFALRKNTPVIVHMHGIPTGRLGPFLYKRYLKQKGKKLTIFTTLGLKQLIEDNLHVKHKESEAFVCSNGVDLNRYQDIPGQVEARRQLGLPKQFTAVYSGGFYTGRGVETIFELAKVFPQVHFLCVGGKPQVVAELQKQVDAEKLTNLTLTGFVANEKLPLYQATADILLMPSATHIAGSSGGNIAAETSPMKLFEYMACKRAILCSDLPVLHEILNNKNAVLYPSEDFQALVDAFTALMKDGKKRAALGAQARLDVTKYSWNDKMRSILDYFDRS